MGPLCIACGKEITEQDDCFDTEDGPVCLECAGETTDDIEDRYLENGEDPLCY